MSDEVEIALLAGWLIVGVGVILCQSGLIPFFEKRDTPWNFSELFGATIASAIWIAPGSAILYSVFFVVEDSNARKIYLAWFVAIVGGAVYQKNKVRNPQV